MKNFVSKEFVVPAGFVNEKFRVRMLTVNDVVKDYDAVVTSIPHLKGVFGPESAWPQDDITLEQDLIDLGWHQKEFQKRSSFAYTVLSLDEKTCLGCIYMYPCEDEIHDAVVYMWVRKSEFDKGLDPVLETSVRDWIRKEWPFKNILYPNRNHIV